jgi:ribose transport system ATP-binding protein
VGGRIRWSQLHRRSREVLERFSIEADPRQPMRSLGPAVQTMVAIARSLQDVDGEHSGVLVLDEPTAALPRAEVEHLLDALRRYAAAGVAIVIVTHRIDEALSVCGTMTVLRDGRHVETRGAEGLDERGLIRMMIGRPIENVFPELSTGGTGEVALDARGLAGGPLQGVDLALRRGEVVGLAGLLGSGRTEVLQTLFGLRDPGPGELRVDDLPTRFAGPAQAMAAGIAYVPEDRAVAAAFLDLPIAENLTIARLAKYRGLLRLDKQRERADARASLVDYLIKAPSTKALMSSLSGGNQQKVVLARWLERHPRILLLDEPTQGVDIGARSEIYRLIRAAVADGCAVLVVSSDFDELIHVSDRILVLAGGRVTKDVDGTDVDQHQLTELTYEAMESAS